MGQAIIFVCSLAGAVIVAFYVLAFSASALLVVVEGTAAGNDEVNWPNEPWADVFGRAGYLGVLLGLWLIPFGFLSRGLSQTVLPGQDVARFILVVGWGLWIFFPIGLLSALRSVSGWGLFRFDVIRDMLRVLPATVLFYAASGALSGLVGFVWVRSLIGNGALVLVAAPLTAIGWLLYARLLGRLAFKMGRLPQPVSKKKATPEKKSPGRKRKGPDPNGPVAPSGEPVPEPEKTQRSLLLDDEPEPYGMSSEAPPDRPNVVPLDGYDPEEAEEVEAPDPKLDNVENANRAIANREKRLTRRRKPPKMPEQPMLEGILTFPFYPQCVGKWINLAFGWALFGFLIQLMLSFNVTR